MILSPKQASEILSISEDELMFLHQQGILTAGINQDTMVWEFPLDKVLEQKAKVEAEAEALAEAEAEQSEE